MNCSISFLLQHLRQQRTIFWREFLYEFVEAAVCGCLREKRPLGNVPGGPQEANLIDELVDDRLVSGYRGIGFVHLCANAKAKLMGPPSETPKRGKPVWRPDQLQTLIMLHDPRSN